MAPHFSWFSILAGDTVEPVRPAFMFETKINSFHRNHCDEWIWGEVNLCLHVQIWWSSYMQICTNCKTSQQCWTTTEQRPAEVLIFGSRAVKEATVLDVEIIHFYVTLICRIINNKQILQISNPRPQSDQRGASTSAKRGELWPQRCLMNVLCVLN